MALKYDDTDKTIVQLFDEIGLGNRGEWVASETHLVFKMGNWVYGARFYYRSKVVRFPSSCPPDVRAIAREAIIKENAKPKSRPPFAEDDPPDYTPMEKLQYRVEDARSIQIVSKQTTQTRSAGLQVPSEPFIVLDGEEVPM